MKKHLYFIAGQFFIWLVPIICLIIMACNGSTNGIKIKTWVSVALVIAVAIYYIKGKKELTKLKDRQLDKDNYVHWWVRLIEWLVAIIPFIVALLLVESIKTDIDETIIFIIICMVSVSIGYIILGIDSKTKEEENKTKNK